MRYNQHPWMHGADGAAAQADPPGGGHFSGGLGAGTGAGSSSFTPANLAGGYRTGPETQPPAMFEVSGRRGRATPRNHSTNSGDERADGGT